MSTKNTIKKQTLTKQSAGQKEHSLRSLMQEMKSVLVAYSGGVDSSYLALIATQELDKKALCITGLSPSVSLVQREQAIKIATDFQFQHQMIETEELLNPDYRANPNNRCYFCKSELYGKLSKIAAEKNIEFVIDGANSDDLSDYRPGSQAATENKVRSPLAEIGFTKKEIREQSKKHKLETWEKPASPCLASRIQYGIPVSIERLGKVERGEEVLRNLGFVEFRVRNHDELVRIEISPDEMEKVLSKQMSDLISVEFSKLGFKYITLDLQGFRSGSMNEMIQNSLNPKALSNSGKNGKEN